VKKTKVQTPSASERSGVAIVTFCTHCVACGEDAPKDAYKLQIFAENNSSELQRSHNFTLFDQAFTCHNNHLSTDNP
jgi:hypothetical protein